MVYIGLIFVLIPDLTSYLAYVALFIGKLTLKFLPESPFREADSQAVVDEFTIFLDPKLRLQEMSQVL